MTTARLDEIITAHSIREAPLMPILNEVQAEFGCIDEEAKRQIAKALNLTRTEVHGIVSFYHDYRETNAELPIIKLCRAEACQSRGSEALAAKAETMANGRASIEPVYCLGLCSVGPNAMIGESVHARLDEPGLEALIREL
ncbi:NAD(P)H-dependent oxidoreductase subunit E [Parasphingopyxis lamellibrachiae]|uniref:Formate dehydrogenase gamma subunit n=1 Tax=Parasphingopyxis lamellibrachiae TaxID=680125 RepID=A0A3D9F8L8_9SPHN|nr:NAD(P)H-dependent oxidoreductase subunit E [Parasphingopyxis lamellibrachiae]RED13361.1 formate dehydrogenase gamma subunit [Parasphingopyxis lamellibrachiae]